MTAGSSITLDRCDHHSSAGLDTAAIESIRKQLRLDNRTKPGMLAAAIDLALDANLLPKKACDDRKLPLGSHTRAKALASRIVADDLLHLCKPGNSLQAPAQVGLSESLLVQQRWVADHAPNLLEVTVGPLVFSSDGRTATRNVFARLDNHQESLCSAISYDVPTTSSERKLYADRHRRREEVAIRELDGAAAAAHRAKKARLQQGLRENRRDVDEEKVLQSVMDRLIREVERHLDAARRHQEQVERLHLPGCAAVHVGDPIYIRHPAFPPPHLQLAVLRRVHQRSSKLDVQLCHLAPPEMGIKCVDRIQLDDLLRGIETVSVLSPVAPFVALFVIQDIVSGTRASSGLQFSCGTRQSLQSNKKSGQMPSYILICGRLAMCANVLQTHLP